MVKLILFVVYNYMNYLLTDFNTERWLGVSIENVIQQIEELNTSSHSIYGEIGNPDTFSIALNKASHVIKNITFSNRKIYGDVEFLKNDYGLEAKYYIDSGDYMFGIRSTGINDSIGTIIIKKIFTWDVIIKN